MTRAAQMRAIKRWNNSAAAARVGTDAHARGDARCASKREWRVSPTRTRSRARTEVANEENRNALRALDDRTPLVRRHVNCPRLEGKRGADPSRLGEENCARGRLRTKHHAMALRRRTPQRLNTDQLILREEMWLTTTSTRISSFCARKCG